MKHRLRHGLAYCLVNTRPVFLDVRRDRYFMIQGALETAFKAFVTSGDLSFDSLDRLVRAGILETAVGQSDTPSPPQTISPRRSIIEERRAQGRLGLAVTMKTAICLLRSRRRLQKEGFARSIERLRARKRDASGWGEACQTFIESKAADFQSARCVFPAPSNCLPDSLALLDYLFDDGVVADFVIGVRMDPYGAHCWVQTKETLLNETVDCARAFTPILAA